MGGSVGPVLTNIIMTECEKVIVNQLIGNDIVKFYIRYFDDTLLVLGKKTLIKFCISSTVDTFESYVHHFLDIEICPDGFSMYQKNTQTWQYTIIQYFAL